MATTSSRTLFTIHLISWRYSLFMYLVAVGQTVLIQGLHAVLLGVPLSLPTISAIHVLLLLLPAIIDYLPGMYGACESTRFERFVAKVCQNYGSLCLFLSCCANALLIDFIIGLAGKGGCRCVDFIIGFADGNYCWHVMAISGIIIFALSYLVGGAANPVDSSSVARGLMAHSTLAAFMFYRAGLPLPTSAAIFHALFAVFALYCNALDIKQRRFLKAALAVETNVLVRECRCLVQLYRQEYCRNLLKHYRGD